MRHLLKKTMEEKLNIFTKMKSQPKWCVHTVHCTVCRQIVTKILSPIAVDILGWDQILSWAKFPTVWKIDWTCQPQFDNHLSLYVCMVKSQEIYKISIRQPSSTFKCSWSDGVNWYLARFPCCAPISHFQCNSRTLEYGLICICMMMKILRIVYKSMYIITRVLEALSFWLKGTTSLSWGVLFIEVPWLLASCQKRQYLGC